MKKFHGWFVLNMLFIMVMSGTVYAKIMDIPDYIRQGNNFFSNGQYDEAARSYKNALLVGSSADAMYNLAITYHHRLNYNAKAMYYYQKFLENDPKAPEATQVKKWLQEVRHKVFPDKVLPGSILDHPPIEEVMITANADDTDAGQGDKFLKEKNYRRAIKSYRKSLVNNKSVSACFNLALIYDFELEHLQKAIYYYQKFLAMAPNHPKANKVSKWMNEAKDLLQRQSGHFYRGEAFQLRQP